MDKQEFIDNKLICHHCGEDCIDDQLMLDDKVFCCVGCQTVFQILSDNGMEAYYELDSKPGQNRRNSKSKDFSYLDDEDVYNRLVDFRENGSFRITLDIPQIHCSSCLWLLENLHQLNEGVLRSTVNFVQKKATIVCKEDQISIRELVTLLSKIGYEPNLRLSSLDEKDKRQAYNKQILYKLGVAGFAFGNIMLLSFPEYLGFHKASHLFFLGYINILLAIPVLFYSGNAYLISAYKALRQNHLNLDIPIALGMLVLFLRSVYEIAFQVGEGYLDSFSGFVFFLLIGSWFQSFTYQSLDFERKYSSYFPIAVLVKMGKQWISKSLTDLQKKDVLLVRSQEIIPCDGVILRGKGRIDYSFVTGESELISKVSGDKVFGGGKNCGSSIQVQVTKTLDDSYLTQLWKEEAFQKTNSSSLKLLVEGISKYFIYVILIIALSSFIAWYWIDSTRAFDVFTAVLIVACPCALALSIPFTYGNIIRLLSRVGLFLKNVETIEAIQDLDEIIFDKTGTITDSQSLAVIFEGSELRDEDILAIKSGCLHSSHPLSQAIADYYRTIEPIEIDDYKDYLGEGFTASIQGKVLKVGSASFIFGTDINFEKGVYVEYDREYVGKFSFEQDIREGLEGLLKDLQKDYQVSILSGDKEEAKTQFEALVESEKQLIFNSSPIDKLRHIQQVQKGNQKVMMIGDGLNDAGALQQAEVGIVMSDQGNNFSPACDGIFLAENSHLLGQIIKFIIDAKWIVYGAFALAFLYNSIGLYFAISGQLTPVVAAILMPLSSITIIVYGVASSYLLFQFYFKGKYNNSTKLHS